MAFNAFAGWNFDAQYQPWQPNAAYSVGTIFDYTINSSNKNAYRVVTAFTSGSTFDPSSSNYVLQAQNNPSIPNAPHSAIYQSYLTLFGSGCQEEYPIVHTQFPAAGCWDDGNGGFGDAWSAQTSADVRGQIPLDAFICDHCLVGYNMKDGAMGPHTLIHNLSLTNSLWVANGGSAGKWGTDAGATGTIYNSVIIGNCSRGSKTYPGAKQNFDQSAGLPGSGLSDYCRAGSNMFAWAADAGTLNIYNNTIINYSSTTWELGCVTDACGSIYNFKNNIFFGIINQVNPALGVATGLYYGLPGNNGPSAGPFWAGSNNLEYNVRNGDTCGANGIVCSDPLFVGEPSSPLIDETILDNFNFHPTTSSPAIGAGAGDTSTLPTDFYGKPQTSPLTMGAAVP